MVWTNATLNIECSCVSYDESSLDLCQLLQHKNKRTRLLVVEEERSGANARAPRQRYLTPGCLAGAKKKKKKKADRRARGLSSLLVNRYLFPLYVAAFVASCDISWRLFIFSYAVNVIPRVPWPCRAGMVVGSRLRVLNEREACQARLAGWRWKTTVFYFFVPRSNLTDELSRCWYRQGHLIVRSSRLEPLHAVQTRVGFSRTIVLAIFILFLD